MIELETIVLNRDIPKHGLQAGDIGAIVHLYEKGNFQAEFVSGEGDTVALTCQLLRGVGPEADDRRREQD